MLKFPQSVRLGGPLARYTAAIALAILAQLARLPLHPPTMVPFITYAPFMVASAMAGGLGPGLLTTFLGTLESVYFCVEPVGSFALANPTNWIGVSVLLVTGVVASVLAERLKRTGQTLIEAHRRITAILDNISDGFNAFDREWRYTYINPAAAKLLGKTREELLGKNLWEMWPEAKNSAFGVAIHRAMAENVPVQVEAFYPAPLNAWIEVRCYPSPEGLTQFSTDTTERKRTEEQLRLLESAVVQTSDGILIVKVSGEDTCCQEPVFANAAFERITGFNLEDLQKEPHALPFSPRLSPHWAERPGSAARTLGTTQLEQPTEREDGTEIWLEWTFKPLAGLDGNHTYCVWTCRDITERKKAEETARLFAAIVEDSDDAILSKNLDGVILTWNKGAERFYGYSSEEMVGQSVSVLMPRERGHELHEILDDLRRGARIEHHDTERLRKDGRRIVVTLSISPIRDARSCIVGACVIARDVTAQKQADEAQALSEQRYRSLALATSQIVWTTDAQGKVVGDMPMWREFTAQGLEEIQGEGRFNALHPDDRERSREVWSKALKRQSFYETEYRLRRHDGEYRWMAVHGVPVLEKDGSIREWVGTCSDIQDRVQCEEEIRKLNQELEQRVVQRTAELESANRELEAFAYSVSHDLRAPLRAVDGFSRILLEEYSPQLPEQAQHYLAVTRKNALQMGALIDDLLAFSRLSRQPLRKQPIAPAELVRQVLDELRAEQEGRRVEITVGDLPPCEGDPGLLKQVLVNLLSNGLKYTRKREVAKIEVGALTQVGGQRPVYYVRDNGVGFDMRYANKLFGVFQRLHGAQEYPGTGVGLAIVQSIVHRHGGHVWAEAGVNQGATFYFVLAAGGAPPAAEEQETCSINP
jgi:PAS domain S-box-containing protein